MSVTEPVGAESAWQPLILDPAAPGCARALRRLRARRRIWQVHDTLELQLRDLVCTRACGAQLGADEIRRRIEEVTGGRPERHGRWVHYPWSGRLVRVLPEPEFRELRLDRNRNKVTAGEQRLLRGATVAIVGLSVGNAAALTLTMEGGCGHLKLADFDRLELSNLNRLRAGIHELGASKAVLAARQIVELDPYASLSVFGDGVTRENLDRFLRDGPRVDVLVDECDSVEIKFLLRERARALRVPVVMETSDRGLIDVERFDLEPGRPIFHGRCGGVSAAAVRTLERAERIGLVLDIVDGEAISARAAASLLEIDTTLSTWPQLASEVALGGATVATAVRRIVLGQPVPSGRSYLDLEHALVGAADPARRVAAKPAGRPPTAEPPLSETVPDSTRFLAEHAALAPSGGNCQPWRFVFDGTAVSVRLDPGRARSLLDLSSHASYLALGAAVENAAIAGAHLGLRVEADPFPEPGDPLLVATLRPERGGATEPELAALLGAVRARATNRAPGSPTAPDTSARARLLEAAAIHGAALELVTERTALDQAAEVLGEADRIRLLSPALHAEAMAEFRWSAEEARCTRDGLDVSALQLGAADRAALRLLARVDAAAELRAVGGGNGLIELARRALAGAGAIGLLRVGGTRPADWLRAGRALERVWLVATSLGLALQPMTSLVYLLELLDRPDAARVLAPADRSALAALGVRLDRLFPADRDFPRALVFRLASDAPPPDRRTLRRPLAEILETR